MGNAQLGRVDDPIVEKQQIEVQRPLAPVDRSLPPESGFDLLQEREATRTGSRCVSSAATAFKNRPWPGGPPTGSVS